jgi:hydrogenase maturation protein HypF
LIEAAVGTEAAKLGPMLQQAWRQQINSPLTSAAGRLFDAAAALTGVCLDASYEGQGPMQLEAVAGKPVDPVAMPLLARQDGVLEVDWRPLINHLMKVNESVVEGAARFHESLAESLLQQALEISRQRPVDAVGLCGGVFQNRRLTEACVQRLEMHGIQVVLGERLPVNDAGLSFGQVVEIAAS